MAVYIIDNEKLNPRKLFLEYWKGRFKHTSAVIECNIDEVFVDVMTHTCVIQGWAVESKTKKPVNLSFFSEQVEHVSYLPRIRQDVNAYLNLPKDTTLGFQIKLTYKGNPNQLWCVLTTEEGVRNPIHIFDYVKFTKDLGKVFAKAYLRDDLKTAVKRAGNLIDNLNTDVYVEWISNHEVYDLKAISANIDTMVYKPVFSIVVPVYNAEEPFLRTCIESVMAQYYPYWELCLADDCSPSPHVKRVLDEYAAKDERIKVTYRKQNGHISRATNTAIDMATGDYIAFMDNDDLLAPFALYENALEINHDPETDFLYSDEDKIYINGLRYDVFFKSDWNDRLLFNHNYITHFVVVKKELRNAVGYLDPEMNGAQDHDFVLRATEQAKKIKHISKVLYHWRSVQGSTADDPEAKLYAYTSGVKSLNKALARRGIDGTAERGDQYGIYRVKMARQPNIKINIVLCRQMTNTTRLAKQILAFYGRTPDADIQFVVPRDYDVNCDAPILHDARLDLKNGLFDLSEQTLEADYLFFWDAQTLPVDEGWLDCYLDEFRTNDDAVTGGKIVYRDTIASAGISILEERKECFHVFFRHSAKPDNLGYYFRLILSQQVFAVALNGMMVKTSVFHELGGFDNTFNRRDAALDFCIQVREAGYNVIWTPYAVLNTESDFGYSRRKIGRRLLKKYDDNVWKDPFYNQNIGELLIDTEVKKWMKI